jgi:predicted RNase H-like nuclease (RuvC/YqgF family)
LEKDQLEYLVDSKTQQIDELQGEIERLRDWSSSGDGANVALSSLVRIVGDNTASTRQRIRAAAAVLGYKTEGDIAQFVKKYLKSVCESTDIATDYRIEAGELLRRHEAPRIAPETVRPAYRDENAGPREPPVPLLELVRQRRERHIGLNERLSSARWFCPRTRRTQWITNTAFG